MDNLKYITVSQYATIKHISKQAVYKQLNNKLKEFLIVVEGVKHISVAVLSEEEIQRLNNFEQPLEQPLNNPIQPILEKQIEEKDKVIESLLRQVESLQTQNERLTELLHNSQVLLATEQKILLEQETTTGKEKRGFFSIFKKRNNKNT